MERPGRDYSTGLFVSVLFNGLSSNTDIPAAFFGIIDLLGILPYYIEIALQQDTVSTVYALPQKTSLKFPMQSTLFRFTILRTFRLLRVFRPFRYNNTILLHVFARSSAT